MRGQRADGQSQQLMGSFIDLKFLMGPVSWNLKLVKITGAKGGHGVLKQDGGGQDTTEVIGREFQNCNLPACEILLVADILLRGDEQGKFALSPPHQITIL